MSFKRISFVAISVILASLYYYFAYQLERSSFGTLLIVWSFLFLGTYCLIHKKYSFQSLTLISFIFRFIFLLTLPNLSQDFYRFIWDGRMILEGFNPYIHLPQTFIEMGNTPVNQTEELYRGMGQMNGSHFTNYPPINQLGFFIAALISNNSILGAAIVMRLQLIIADAGILFFGSKVLQRLGKDPKKIFWYILNPFIIIELVGNLHYEPLMLFFFILSIYQLQKKKWVLGGILLALSINVKLIPLLFLPLFLQYFRRDGSIFLPKSYFKLIRFYIIVLFTSLILFLPFVSSQLIDSYMNSVGLWFRSFEFNASFYYIFREIGFWFRGYNEIAVIGKILPVLSVIFILIISLYRKNKSIQDILSSMLFVLSFYYFMSTTIHPWYVATLVLLSVFTKYTYPIIWSIVIIFSYQAYANIPWKENLWFVTFEYLIVYAYLVYEIKKPTQRLSGKNCYEKEKESGL
jgi:alpha-1,6-mannosyltransferase